MLFGPARSVPLSLYCPLLHSKFGSHGKRHPAICFIVLTFVLEQKAAIKYCLVSENNALFILEAKEHTLCTV